MPKSFRSWSLLWLLVLAALSAIVFLPGLRGGYFADDYCYYFYPPSSKLLYYFTHQNPGSIIYRPLLSTFLAGVQSVWGMEPLPIHLMNLLCHVVLSWLVAQTVVRLGYTRMQAMIGSLFLLVGQITTYAVLGIDTLSQVGGVLFGSLSAWLLFFPGRMLPESEAIESGVNEAPRPIPRYFLLSLLSFAVSLCLKETSTAYLGVVGVALLAGNLEQSGRARAFMRTAVQLLPFILLVTAYMIVRSQFVSQLPQFGTSRYDMRLGMNIPKNIAMFLAASSTAHSSVTAFVAMHQKDLPMLAMIAIPALLFAGLLGWGLWRVRHDRPVPVFLLLYFLGFFPIILFNQVSELYIYNALPFLAVLTGIALGELLRSSTERLPRIALGIAIVSLIGINIASTWEKSAQLRFNGERAGDIIEQLRPIVRNAPRGDTVYLLNPPNSTVEYSTFVMNDFDLLIAGQPGIASFLGREDLTLEIVAPGDSTRNLHATDDSLVLTIRDGRVVPARDRFPQ